MARSTRVRKGASRPAGARSRHSQRVDIVYALTHLSLETRALLVILLAALLLRIVPLGAFSTEFDEGVYWLTLGAMAQGHPLYTSIYNAQAPFFFPSIYPLFMLFGQTIIAARFVVTLYSLLGIVAIYLIGSGLGGRYVGLAAGALLAVDPLYLTLSRTLEAEVPALALMLLGIALAIYAARRGSTWRRWLIVASGALLGLALMIKLLAIVGIVPAALVLIWPGLLLPVADGKANTSGARRRLRSHTFWNDLRKAWPEVGLLLAGFAGACVLTLVPFLGSLGTVYAQVVGVYVAVAHVFGQGPMDNLRAIGSLGSEYWLFVAALAALALAIWRRSPIVLLGAIWALISLLAVLAQPTPWPRHAVFLIPPLALLAGLALRLAPPLQPVGGRRRAPSAIRLRQALRQPTVVTYAALIVLGATFAIGLIISAVEDERAINYPAGEELLIAYTLSSAVPPGDIVVTDNPYLAGLTGLREPPELIDTSFVRIESGNLTARQLEIIITRDDVRAVLFESGRFDTIPGFRDWVKTNFEVRKDFGNGRVLYVKGAQGPVPV